MKYLVPFVLLAAAVPAAAKVDRLANWGDGNVSPCDYFAPPPGFCSKLGRWIVNNARTGVATVYLPDGRKFQMPVILAEANGGLDTHGHVFKHKSVDEQIDEALGAADVPD